MKKFFSYLKDYISNTYSFSTYAVFFIFTGLLIAINFKLNFEDDYIDRYNGRNIRILFYTLVQLIPFLICLFLIVGRTKQTFWKDKIFWLKLILGFSILGLDRAFHFHYYLIQNLPGEVMIFAFKCLNSSVGILTSVFLLFLLYTLIDKNRIDTFYGLTFKDVDYKAYLLLFVLMIPLVFGASFLTQFTDYYPKYKSSLGEAFALYYDLPIWLSVLVYEISYLSDFLSIELFFRGFLIIGLAPHLGKHVILPMACTYAVLHFGKPLGECISSVFGGYILGVIALYSRNIWGGVVLHMGVAALMEFFAFLQIQNS